MTDRTTFFTLRAVDPYVEMADACEALPDTSEHARLMALERLAARHGMELVSAGSIARDSKGWIGASRRDIVVV